MTYKDLFDAQHEYCKTEQYPGTAIRPQAFIDGAKCVTKYLNDLSARLQIYTMSCRRKKC